MENLKTESIKIRVNDGMEEYVAEEKDHGDLVVYDISREGHYLLTMARDGSILFMNFDADEKDREIFKLSHLNTFIEKIKTLSKRIGSSRLWNFTPFPEAREGNFLHSISTL
jgi:hypothetical protein